MNKEEYTYIVRGIMSETGDYFEVFLNDQITLRIGRNYAQVDMKVLCKMVDDYRSLDILFESAL